MGISEKGSHLNCKRSFAICHTCVLGQGYLERQVMHACVGLVKNSLGLHVLSLPTPVLYPVEDAI